MPGAIGRYILRQIGGPLVFITLTLTSIIWLTQALRLLDRFVGAGLGFGDYIWLTGLLLPSLLAIVVPIAAFCATLYAYHRLITDSELVVLWSAGCSRLTLARPALLLAAGVTAIVYVLVLFLVPLSASTFRTAQYEFRSALTSLVIHEGEFNTPVAGLTVYVRERSASGELRGILVHDNRDTARPVTMMAERGALVRTPQGPRFIMVSGNRQQIDQAGRQLSLLYFDSYTLDLDAFAKNEGAGWRQPGERYLHELLWPDMDDANDRENYWRLVVQGHRNLAQPLYVPALILIALATVLAAEFNRRGQARRLVAAAAAAIVLQVLSLGIGSLVGRSPAFLPLVYLLPMAFMAGATWLLFNERPARRQTPQPTPA